MRVACAVLAAFVLLCESAGAARQDPAARSPRNASYTLTVSLDPATHGLTGRGRLTWRNITHTPAAELRFHLYWNAFRNSASTWMRESQLARPGAFLDRPIEDWGSIDLSALSLAGASGAIDLMPRVHFVAPDDGNPNDRTVIAVPLDRPVAPGETIDVDLAWRARVPRTFARTGVVGDDYFIGQWFPKIGVFEDSGWNCHQFHAATEFFADFGRYDVTINVPRGWIVGATGREQDANAPRLASEASPIEAVPAAPPPAGSIAHRFVEDDVHDFAWTTSPHYLDLHESFDAAGLPPVDMRLLLQPEHASQAARYFEATRVALGEYGAWFGAYPYGHITIVDPVAIFNAPAQGETTGGMEYPTLFTGGTRYVAPPRGLAPESVTIHEAGHQFWYGLVATNEFEDAWMDEGINTYSQARAIAEGLPAQYVAVNRYFGGLLPWAYEDVPWTREVDGDRLNTYRPSASADAPSTPTFRQAPRTAGAITYDKTALWMSTLERYLGWPTMQKVMATYFARGVYRHPAPEEFFATADEISGQDLGWFFDGVYRSSATFDYAVGDVTTTPSTWHGLPNDAAPPAAPGGFLNVVTVMRKGDGVFPVPVRVTFENGVVVVEQWDGRDRSRVFRYRQSSPVRTVEIDPDRVLLLDVNETNNTWTAYPHAADAASRWSWRWLTWFEDKLLTYAFFG